MATSQADVAPTIITHSKFGIVEKDEQNDGGGYQ